MVQAADFRKLYDSTRRGRFGGSEVWGILVEREMCPRVMVVGEVAGQDAAEMSFAQDENVIQTLAPDRADQALHERVLPGAVRHDEDEEDAEASGRHGEEVDRNQVADVVAKERPPGLRGLRAVLRHEAGDGAFGDVDAEFQQVSVDARGAPEGIRGGHLSDQGADLGIYWRGGAR